MNRVPCRIVPNHLEAHGADCGSSQGPVSRSDRHSRRPDHSHGALRTSKSNHSMYGRDLKLVAFSVPVSDVNPSKFIKNAAIVADGHSPSDMSQKPACLFATIPSRLHFLHPFPISSITPPKRRSMVGLPRRNLNP